MEKKLRVCSSAGPHKIEMKKRIAVSPAPHARKEKGKLKQILKRLIQLRKGH